MGEQAESALVHFKNVSVTTITNASGVFVGTNTQYGWASHEKGNEAFGSVYGNLNVSSGSLHLLFDNDQIDSPIEDADFFYHR